MRSSRTRCVSIESSPNSSTASNPERGICCGGPSGCVAGASRHGWSGQEISSSPRSALQPSMPAERLRSFTEAEAVGVDRELEQAFFVLALPHLEDVEAASELRLDLDVLRKKTLLKMNESPPRSAPRPSAAISFVKMSCRRRRGRSRRAPTRSAGSRSVSRAANASSARLSMTTRLTSPPRQLAADELRRLRRGRARPARCGGRSARSSPTSVQSQPGRRRLLPDLRLGLLKRDVEAAFALLEARGDEAQREQRLADPGRADQERRVAARNAAADRGVELLDAEAARASQRRDARGAASSRGAGRPRCRRC